ncbi:class I SAM-dependent methyltransferase [Pseudonocardia xinjiangensis]|uniref:class I SAM-dependent methyltransferase n=1 Tax=Pseudonocardia xinjiangensis TaxID=75289 RepID=UPI0028B12871|nr:class I SAM-dependent methyltransferase [Pseudonocardia xinjiangensis]
MTFAGEVADYYSRFRRGYPPPVTDFLVCELGVGAEDVVVDLGCGTGQLAIPLASRVRHVVGVDPEPDMLAHARRAAREHGVGSASWVLGSDADLPTLGGLLGGTHVAAVTVSCAIHLMDSTTLFAGLRELLPPGGRVAVIANGTPIWLQASAWSRALRGVLEQHFGRPLTATCGTDDVTREGYRTELETAGFATSHAELGYHEAIDIEWIVGNLYSAMSPHQLPRKEDRPAFAQQVEDALRSAQPKGDFVDDVRVAVLLGERR